ncbi:MAG: hypothetical protein GAK28_04074 [Luteibacter sp.]|uniref:glycine-rich domain-containing protein n=1 Tax=Luteibacter sp. TaxID=1886636 RepID=UPI001384C8A6|nr:hypothetical protein [Luteibacter sp.]KAF1004367.1 MAG: hypothetical protein GAK28_04074 [Luteibacter sp.]
MDRKIVYPGQIPLETDLLGTNQSVMVALGKLTGAIFGTGGAVNGLTVGPNAPAALNVVVAPGEIYQLVNLEATAYSSLPADIAHQLVKQGILLDATTLACPAPTTAGFSINYLIEATYADSDTNNTTLPYYNASNPSQAYSGPNNSGLQQATTRAGIVQLQAKAGIAAATGSQVTPAVDSGYIALAVVTVANGQTTISAGNIATIAASKVLPTSILGMFGQSRQQQFTSSGSFTVPAGITTIYVSAVAGGGGGGGGGGNNIGGASASGGGGGGAGQSIIRQAFTVTPGQVIPITIGTAGSGGAGGAQSNSPAPVAGTAGGQTIIGSLITLTGGSGGGAGFPGASTGTAIPGADGGAGYPAGCASTDGTNTGLTSGVGWCGASGAGASSPFGGGGPSVRTADTNPRTNPSTAYGYGSGGGGGGAVYRNGGGGSAGRNGAPGVAIIEW